MEKQTAVEWLIAELSKPQYPEDIKKICDKALEMEKQQMHKCASFWRGKENEIEKHIFDEWYREQLKQRK